VAAFTSLREITRARPEEDSHRTAVKRIEDQLIYGVLPEKQILQRESVFEDYLYLVERRQDKDARATIEQGPWRDLVFVGEIASGKSASTLNLAIYLLDRGYRVFYAIQGSSLQTDLTRWHEPTRRLL
jgi:hypothetical protein